MKIVNGGIVREGDIPSNSERVNGSTTGSPLEGSDETSFLNRRLPICGYEISYWSIALCCLISFLFNGVGGLFFSGLLFAGLYYYGQHSSSSGSGGGGGGTSSSGGGGWNQMNTKSGSNIRTVKDLPPPPKS